MGELPENKLETQTRTNRQMILFRNVMSKGVHKNVLVLTVHVGKYPEKERVLNVRMELKFSRNIVKFV